MTRYLIIALLFVLVRIPLFSQEGNPSDDIKMAYLNLDERTGNILLSGRLSTTTPEYIRMAALRDFLSCLLYQTESSNARYYSKADYWLKKLELDRSSTSVSVSTSVEISIYRAVLASQFSDYKTSSLALIRACKEINRNGGMLGNSDREKLTGILGILFSLVPDQAMKIVKLTGVRPANLGSFAELENYYRTARPGSADRLEGWLLLVTSLKEFSGDPAKAWEFVRKEGDSYPGNPLVRYQSALAALKAGYNDEAIRLLEGGFADPSCKLFPAWNYQLGRCYLNSLDPRAGQWLTAFISSPGGETYRHVAHLRLAWHYLVQGKADESLTLCRKIGNLPEAHSVYDKQAVREAESQTLPDQDLIRLRLLFDGGYYERCLAGCCDLESRRRLEGEPAVELIYRKARCYHRTGLYREAIEQYLKVIGQKKQVKSYWLPNSALQLGYLYREMGRADLARKYFKLCMELNDFGYREGINREAQAALAGLAR